MRQALSEKHRRPKSIVLAVAAHVEDGAPAPPELDWWRFREWGAPYAGGWLDYPAAEFARARAAKNVYIAMNGFKAARDLPTWCDANPDAWNLVSYVLGLKQEAADG